jgi:hypothetical protein
MTRVCILLASSDGNIFVRVGRGTRRTTTTSPSGVEPPLGARHEAKHAKGDSQSEGGLGLIAAVHKIDRRRKKMTWMFWV